MADCVQRSRLWPWRKREGEFTTA